MHSKDDQEPIAIIGAACRLPGEVSSLGSLWDMISNARTGHCEVPSDRWDGDLLHHPNPDRKGNMAVKHGYFLKQDISHFDAPFFSTTAKEAAALDPMKRLLLEVSYESIENAGIPMQSLVNSDTGCYVGCMTNDYEMLSTQDIQDMGYSAATGLSEAMISNRVSWFFGLRGPSLTVDTACSSSLYALHLACQALKLGEINQALVGGVNLVLYPNCMEQFSAIHMLSPEGISHSFDDRANGYGRGEGIGCMVVKRLSDALRDGDTIRAVVRHTGVNADGKTPSITQPSSEAQADLIRRTYKAAGLSLSSTEYFESHGTGTPVGDPIELSALAETIGAARRAAGLGPLYFGSIKPSVGHTEGCSGLAGVFKSILCLEKGMLVPTYGVERVNPRLTLDAWHVTLPQETMAWPSKGLRRISVNSFGFGGANAHVILDDAHHYLSDRGLVGNHNTVVDEDDDSSESGIDMANSTTLNGSTEGTHDGDGEESDDWKQLFVFSTQDQAGIKRIAQTYQDSLAKTSDAQYIRNLAYTLAERRSHHDFRTFSVASSLSELATELAKPPPAGKTKRVSRRGNKNLAFVFTGQGAQWPAMGRQLMRYAVFERSVRASQRYLEEHGCPWDAVEELLKSDAEGSKIGLPEYSQTLCTVLQVALVDLLRHWGVKPRAVVGHSSGEIAAAYAASYISHSDAVKIAYVRGVSSASVTRHGAMMAAGLSRAEAEEYLARVPAEVGVAVTACVNSPKSVTLSGDVPAVDALEAAISADGRFARKLKVKTAYHSPHMRQVSEDYFRRMGRIETMAGNGETVMFSSLTGKMVERPEQLDAQYWVDNMCNTVEFSAAVATLLSYTTTTSTGTSGRTKASQVAWGGIVEVGPHAALQGPVQQSIDVANNASAKEAPYVSLVVRGQDGVRSALAAAGKLWVSGIDMDLRAVNRLPDAQAPAALQPKPLADLPSYPWNHGRSYWHEASATRSIRFPLAARTDLLGMPEDVQNPMQPRWKNYLRMAENPWIEDHKITGTVLYPGAGMLVMALEGALQLADKSRKVRGFRFRDVAFERGLVVPSGDDEPAVETRLSFVPDRMVKDQHHFTVFSYNGSVWTQHCNGTISVEYVAAEKSEVDGSDEEDAAWAEHRQAYKALCDDGTAEDMDLDDFYEHLESHGMEYGPMFRNVSSLRCSSSHRTAYGSISIPDTASVMPAGFEYPHVIHPATMDAIFHLLLAAVDDGRPTREAAVPFGLEDMFVAADQPQGAGAVFEGYSQLTGRAAGGREVTCSLVVADETWQEPRIVASGFSLRQVTAAADGAAAGGANGDGGPGGLKKSALVTWKPDLDFMSLKADLGAWLDGLTHKMAVENVLLVIDDTSLPGLSDIVHDMSRRVNHKPGFGKLSSLATSTACLESMAKAWSDENTDVKLWDVVAGHEIPAAAAEGYNLVVVLGHQTLGSKPEALQMLEKALGPDGHFVIRPSHDLPREALVKSLEVFENMESSVDSNFDILYASKEKQAESQLPSDVYILTTSTRSSHVEDLTANLSATLASLNVTVHTTTPEAGNVQDLADKYVVSLLEVETPFIYAWTEDHFLFFKTLVASVKHLLWITHGSLMESWAGGVEFAPAQGLLRVMRNEYPLAALPHLDMSSSFDASVPGGAEFVAKVWRASMGENAETEFAELDGTVHIPRAVEQAGFDNDLQIASGVARPVSRAVSGLTKPMKVSSTVDGGDLLWVEDELAESLSPDQVEVKVEYFGLGQPNSTDDDSTPATDGWTSDVVGTVQRCGANVKSVVAGQRVVAFQAEGCKSTVCVDEAFTAPIPEGLSLEVAAGSLSILITARYALLYVARLRAGQTVLVHNAASALGQAAIHVSRANGADVFALVERGEDKTLLMEKLGVSEDRIFDSSRQQFVNSIMKVTNGRGVDAILCNEHGPAVQPSLEILADFGHFLDLTNSTKNSSAILIPASKRNASIVRLDTASLRKSNPGLAQELFQSVMAGPVATMYPTTIYSVNKAAQAMDAFRSRQRGTVVMSFDGDSSILTMPPPIEKLSLDPSGTYVLAGGLGAVGLNIANMMAEYGAKHLVFLSRSGGSKNQEDLERFKSQGILAEAFACDVNNAESVKDVFDGIRGRGHTIKGLVQCAMVLEDTIFDNMTHEKWTRAFKPKSQGSRNLLDNLSAADSPFFILLSSITGVIGNTAQANYASGNTFEDALAHHARSHLGIPATSIDVGLVDDSSHFTATGGFGDLKSYLHRYQHGWVGLRCTLEELAVALRAIMRGSTADGGKVPAQLVFGLGDGIVRTPGSTGYERDRKFNLRVRKPDDGDAAGRSGKVNVGELLSKATSLAEAAKAVEDVFRAQIALEFGVEESEVDTQRPLPELGVDSLKAVEMRNRALKDMQSDISVFELLSASPLTEVAAKIASRSQLVSAEARKGE